MKASKYSLTLDEVVDVLQIISIHKKVEVSKSTGKEKQESIQLFDTLIETILLGNKNGNILTYEANNRIAFGIWYAVDLYKTYLTEQGFTDELSKVDSLLAKLACKA